MVYDGTAAQKAAVRTGFVALARQLGAALDVQGKLLAITVGPRTSATDPNWAVFDYAGLAPSADRFRIMTYDKHWSGGPAGAVAPLSWVKSVLTYAVTAVPPSKIDVGVPQYGYDWPITATGYGTAVSLTYDKVETLRNERAATRQYSAADAAPWFNYTAADGKKHVVWYNDQDSTKAKMTLVGLYGLHGMAFWAVGTDDARQWAAVRTYAIQRSTKLTISAPAAVVYGSAATVTGKLTNAAGTTPIAGTKVALQWRLNASAAWSTVATGTTSSSGVVSLKHSPGRNGMYRLYAYGTFTYMAASSGTATTWTRWRATAGLAATKVKKNATIKLSGKVAPVRAGTVAQRQRYLGPNKWALVSTTPVKADGTYTFSFTSTKAGTFTYRVVITATTLNAAGVSPAVKVKVT
jgi:hypothetical protein